MWWPYEMIQLSILTRKADVTGLARGRGILDWQNGGQGPAKGPLWAKIQGAGRGGRRGQLGADNQVLGGNKTPRGA